MSLRDVVEEAKALPLDDMEAIRYAEANRWLKEHALPLAELVADMAEALNEVLSDGDLPDDETDAMVVAALAHLAALFPEDSA